MHPFRIFKKIFPSCILFSPCHPERSEGSREHTQIYPDFFWELAEKFLILNNQKD